MYIYIYVCIYIYIYIFRLFIYENRPVTEADMYIETHERDLPTFCLKECTLALHQSLHKEKESRSLV